MLQSEARRYRVLEAIGKGGFGTVYKAELLGAGGFVKTVALKVLNDSAAAIEGTSERLRDEARMLGLLNHRAIVQVDGFLQLNGRWTVVMEYIEGVDLKQLLKAGPLPVGVALEIVQEVSNALYVAYERPSSSGEPLRLLHRDLKPSNIHLTPAGGVKVLDFGVARAEFSQREARTQAIAFGSMGYMAPERLENVNSHAADVYSLGAILYELLLAAPLGRTDGQPAGHDALVQAGLDRLWQVAPQEDLYHLVAECLSFAPEGRPPARELERRLRALRMQFPGPWLSDWAEDVVPGVAAALVRDRDEVVGAVLTEDGTPPSALAVPTPPVMDSAPPPPEQWEEQEEGEEEQPPAPRTWALLLAAGASALLVAGIGGGALYLVWSHRQAGQTPPVEEVGGTAAIEAPPVEPPPVEAPPVETPPVETPPAVVETPPPPVETPPVETPPPPVETPPVEAPPTETPPTVSHTTTRRSYGSVVIQGDMSGVVLVSGSRSYPQGRIPAGSYTVRASIDGVATDVAHVTVAANQVVTLACKARFKSCVPL